MERDRSGEEKNIVQILLLPLQPTLRHIQTHSHLYECMIQVNTTTHHLNAIFHFSFSWFVYFGLCCLYAFLLQYVSHWFAMRALIALDQLNLAESLKRIPSAEWVYVCVLHVHRLVDERQFQCVPHSIQLIQVHTTVIEATSNKLFLTLIRSMSSFSMWS